MDIGYYLVVKLILKYNRYYIPHFTLRSENKRVSIRLFNSSKVSNELNKVILYTNQWFVLYASYVLIVIEQGSANF